MIKKNIYDRSNPIGRINPINRINSVGRINLTRMKHQSRINQLKLNNRMQIKHTAPAFGSFINIPRPRSISMFTPVGKRPAATFWGDSDHDGVMNGLDCRPFNARLQGAEHDEQSERELENKKIKDFGVSFNREMREKKEKEKEKKEEIKKDDAQSLLDSI